MSHLTFDWESDDVCVVYLDGAALDIIDHDAYDRSGMKIVIDMLKSIARRKDWKVEVVGKPGV